MCKKIQEIGNDHNDKRSRKDHWNQLFTQFKEFKLKTTDHEHFVNDTINLSEKFSFEDFSKIPMDVVEKLPSKVTSDEPPPVTVETIAYPKNELHDLKSLEKKRAAAVEKKIGFESKAKEAENEINKLDFAIKNVKTKLKSSLDLLMMSIR